MGVKLYCITNRVNGKMYVGVTEKTVDVRWYEHVRYALKPTTNKFSKALRKHTAVAFCVDELFDYETREAAYAAERALIAALDLMSSGYNSTPGGDFNPALLPEIAKKISIAKQGQRPCAATLEAARRVRQGVPLTAEHKARMSAALRGRINGPLSEEHKARISKTLKGRTCPTRTPEHCAALSRAHAGKSRGPASQETRDKMRTAQQRRREIERSATCPM